MADTNPLTNFMPDMAGIPNMDWTGFMTKFIWIVMAAILLIVFMRMIKHRRLVEIYEEQKDGYVLKSGRYAVAFDKENNLEYLRPITGKKRLPNFPFNAWQKVNGVPFIGINRSISIIKRNEYSYRVLVPPDVETRQSSTEYADSLSWSFIEHKRKFDVKMKRTNMLYYLSIFAPSAIIIGSIVFFVVMMLLNAGIINNAADKINLATNTLAQYCGGLK